MRLKVTSGEAFTMGELVVVIAVMGVLALVAVPVFVGIRRASLENAAVQRARLVNAARDSYALTVPAAAASWAAAPDDGARLQLLTDEDLLAGAPAEYLAMEGDFSVSLGPEIRARTVLLQAGQPFSY